LKSTGTPTLGLGVTINSSGLVVTGVATAGVGSFTTVYGDGSNLTGVGETIAPWHYNPDVNDTTVTVGTGIGITFNKKVEAGSGTATLKIVNAGAAGTTIQSWGVSSCTFNVTEFTMGALVSALTVNQTYQLDIPATFIDDPAGSSYVGTAYTFTATPPVRKLWAWGRNLEGQSGTNDLTQYSSPVQVPGVTWADYNTETSMVSHVMTKKTDGTLWGWGLSNYGQVGSNAAPVNYSSPIQIGTDTTWGTVCPLQTAYTVASKTNGTLWSWGSNTVGQLGLNQGPSENASSPIQIPGTTWATGVGKIGGGYRWCGAIKTDGSLWMLGGEDDYGELCQNNNANFSSPIQIHGGGTTWNYIGGGWKHGTAVKTDGTLWVWGNNQWGQLGVNNQTRYSSPVQVPGTTWSKVSGSEFNTLATKTDGTAWGMGYNGNGHLGLNNTTNYSSPVQIPGTTWDRLNISESNAVGLKTNGTLWAWGINSNGQLAQNNTTKYSSPVQVGSETGYTSFTTVDAGVLANQLDQTP
jgi:alpha-tubulin suppressor-like RCC1 family protein